LCCGYNKVSNARVLAVRQLERRLPIALGVHPWYATLSVVEVLAMVEAERPNALGEIGLDGNEQEDIPPLSVQEPAFVAQLDAAARLHLPVTVHSRQAVARVVDIVRSFTTVRGVLHAYSGPFEQIRDLLDRGWMVGVGGAVTRPSARKIRQLVARLPVEALLLETDCPSMWLAGVEPSLVRPHHVVEVAKSVAALRQMERLALEEQTDRNAVRMFGEAVAAFQSGV
jgi:TatD DNase family protein